MLGELATQGVALSPIVWNWVETVSVPCPVRLSAVRCFTGRILVLTLMSLSPNLAAVLFSFSFAEHILLYDVTIGCGLSHCHNLNVRIQAINSTWFC